MKWVLLVTVPRTVLGATASVLTRLGNAAAQLVLRTHPVGSVVLKLLYKEMVMVFRMNKLDVKSCAFSSEEKGFQQAMGDTIFPEGSRVCVISYSPFRGLRGTVRQVHTISADSEEPFCFYLITLERAQVEEPIWFEYDEVELVTPSVSRRGTE